MNCFICGSEMKEDWYDGIIYHCSSKEPEHTFYTHRDTYFYFSFPEFACHFELDIFHNIFSTFMGYSDKASNNLKDMLYWTCHKELIAYAKKVLTFQ